MAKQARRHGRGLDSLVTDLRGGGEAVGSSSSDTIIPARSSIADVRASVADAHSDPRTIPVDLLDTNPYQPRRAISSESVASLSESIAQNGMLQPILVRRDGGRFQIIAGERRYRAAKLAGLTEVPVVVRDADDQQMLELALIENIQREDLNAIERALGYREYMTRFGLKADEVARRLGEDRSTVVNYLRLLDLDDPIRDLVADRRVSMGHARALLGIEDRDRRIKLAESVVAHELSVRALEEIVRREKTRGGRGGDRAPTGPREVSAHVRDVERQLEELLKTKVTICEGKRKGTGRIVVEYYSLDDFDRFARLLGVRFA